MASGDSFIPYLLELLKDFGPVHAKKMFGGHGLFKEGRMFALVADDTLYIKADDHNRARFEAGHLERFMFERHGKQVAMSYYMPPESALEDPEVLLEWAMLGYEAAKRTPKK